MEERFVDKKLKELFDFQKFEKNPRLEKMIGETEERCGRELSDDELSGVSAAGELTVGGQIIKEQKKD